MTAVIAGEIKARGAFYTPAALTRFLSQWAIRTPEDRVLEPSCGDGAFIAAAKQRFRELGRVDVAGHLFGAERELEEADSARALAPDAVVLTTDFFELAPTELPPVDVVLGNPPYIRYHGFRGEVRGRALTRAREQGVELSGLASSWAHFVAHSGSFLRADGRLALVLPAELMHTDYARPIREWLRTRFRSIRIVAFDRMAFPEAEVDAVLLLASNRSEDGDGFAVIRVPDASALADLAPATTAAQGITSLERWTSAFDDGGHDLYASLVSAGKGVRLGSIASVDIGVVTGANKFFVLSPEEAVRRKLPDSTLVPVLESPSAARGLELRSGEAKRLLLIGEGTSLSTALRDYLDEGERQGIPQRYKCRTRSLWYRVPTPKRRPNAFLPYMNNQWTRLIANPLSAWSTNLVHGVTFTDTRTDARVIAVAMLSATTQLSAEIEGRAYGGGVLKFETKEAERLYVPNVDDNQREALLRAFGELDRLVVAGRTAEASATVDLMLDVDHEPYRLAADVYRRRRLNRGRRRREPAMTSEGGLR